MKLSVLGWVDERDIANDRAMGKLEVFDTEVNGLVHRGSRQIVDDFRSKFAGWRSFVGRHSPVAQDFLMQRVADLVIGLVLEVEMSDEPASQAVKLTCCLTVKPGVRTLWRKRSAGSLQGRQHAADQVGPVWVLMHSGGFPHVTRLCQLADG